MLVGWGSGSYQQHSSYIPAAWHSLRSLPVLLVFANNWFPPHSVALYGKRMPLLFCCHWQQGRQTGFAVSLFLARALHGQYRYFTTNVCSTRTLSRLTVFVFSEIATASLWTSSPRNCWNQNWGILSAFGPISHLRAIPGNRQHKSERSPFNPINKDF